mmetsp:Transcript_120094/g.339816  ORF Transcript_120094/g.339816 Transcript_120094/m.339816 type:complete len:266 (-) Transcript_120094:76-873(-)
MADHGCMMAYTMCASDLLEDSQPLTVSRKRRWRRTEALDLGIEVEASADIDRLLDAELAAGYHVGGSNDADVERPSCGHRCELRGGCCRCVTRALKPRVLPGLDTWCRQHGVVDHLPGSSSCGWRFFCGACCVPAGLAARAGEVCKLPLPFGGALVRVEGFDTARQLVAPTRFDGIDSDYDYASDTSSEAGHASSTGLDSGSACSETGFSSDADQCVRSPPRSESSRCAESIAGASSDVGSWVAVEAPGMRRTPSASSWILADID